MSNGNVLVAGAGGFIGGHLTAELIEAGNNVRAVDIKPLNEWYQVHPASHNLTMDLSLIEHCRDAVQNTDTVYNLAADMGGMGFIQDNKALCMLTALISTHMLLAARDAEVERFFFSSSACVYAADKQASPNVTALSESDAYPAMPEDGYGWEKLFTERMCRHFLEDFGLQTRVARYHNVYGPFGAWNGGREKAPAAICRKVATAVITLSSEIEIWGDGEQTRSFTFIDDCVKGTLLIAQGSSPSPVNLGSSELVTINTLVDIIGKIAGVSLERKYVLSAPQGVRGRNSDNSQIESTYGWQPSTTLMDGLQQTYSWIYQQVEAQLAGADPTRVNEAVNGVSG